MSAAVRTAATPGNASARATASRMIDARAWGLRSVMPHRAPGTLTSDANENVPRTFGPPSGRSMDAPTPRPETGRGRTGEVIVPSPSCGGDLSAGGAGYSLEGTIQVTDDRSPAAGFDEPARGLDLRRHPSFAEGAARVEAP